MKSGNKFKLICVRLDEEEFKEFFVWYSKSTSGSYSAYIRSVLLKKPVVLRYHNDSIDDFLESMLDLKKDLKSLLRHLDLGQESKGPPEAAAPAKDEINRKILASAEAIQFKISALYQSWLQSPG